MYKAGAGHKGNSVHLARIYTEDVAIGLTISTRAMAGVRSKTLGGVLL